MRQRQENLICKQFQQDILSEERKDLGKSYVRIFKGPFTYVGLPVLLSSSAQHGSFAQQFSEKH